MLCAIAQCLTTVFQYEHGTNGASETICGWSQNWQLVVFQNIDMILIKYIKTLVYEISTSTKFDINTQISINNQFFLSGFPFIHNITLCKFAGQRKMQEPVADNHDVVHQWWAKNSSRFSQTIVASPLHVNNRLVAHAQNL